MLLMFVSAGQSSLGGTT